MPANDDVTTRFVVDISDLKAGISQANKQIKSANAQFKAAASGMDDWSSSSEGLEAKVSQMTAVLDAERAKLRSYEQQLAAVTAAADENGRRAEDLQAAHREACDQFGENSAEAAKLKSALADVLKEQSRNESQAEALATTIANQTAKVNSASKQLDKYGSQLADSKSETGKLTREISEQEDELARMRSAYTEAVLAFGKGSSEAKALEGGMADLSKELRENKQRMEDATSAAKELASTEETASDAVEGCTSSITAGKVALGALVAGGLKMAIDAVKQFASDCLTAARDYQTSTSMLQAGLGVTREDAQRFADIGRDIYNGGWGDSLNQVITSLKQTKDTLRDVSDEDLRTVTQGAQILADTLGMDVGESVRGINALMHGFGLSATEATDLYVTGVQRGLDYTDELGDNLSEYSVRWGEAGMSASQYFSLLQAGTDNGAYNLDKVGDYLNEFLTSLDDGRMSEAMGKMSSGTREVFDQYKAGGATAQDVLNAVISELGGMTSETDRAALASELWSSLGEDNAMGMILSLGSVQDSYGDVAGAAEDAGAAASDNFGAQATSAVRTLQSGIADKLMPVLSDVTAKFSEWVSSDAGQRFFADIGSLVGELVTKLSEFGSWVMEHKDEIAAFFVAVGTGIAVFKGAQAVGVFVGFLQGLSKAAKLAAAGQLALNAAQMANPIGLVVGLIAGLVAAILYLWNTNEDFRNFVTGAWDAICGFVGEKIDAIGRFFTVDIPGAIDAMGARFAQLPADFQAWLDGVISSVTDWVVGMAQQAQDAGTRFFSNIAAFFTQLPANFQAWLNGVISSVGSWVLNMAAQASNAGSRFVSNVGTFLASLPGRMLTWLGQAALQVLSWGSSLSRNGGNAIRDLIAGISAAAGSIPGKMAEIGDNIVRGVWNGIQNAAGWFKSQVQGFFGGIVDGAKRALGINSPSKVMEEQVGKWIPAGAAKGIVNNMGVLKRAMGSMSGVIALDAQSKRLGASSATAAAAPSVYNFTQNNYSPKALSRLEIYRQTRNQVRSAVRI